MKRPAVLAAAAVVLLANAWTWFSVSWNRGEALGGGRLVLTERELRLPRAIGESTALFLELEWDTPHSPSESRKLADWLDTAKLAELGFDTRVPDCAPDHDDCEATELTRPVFVVLELVPERRQHPLPEGGHSTGLLVIDAGLDPQRLRERYPDTTRHVLARGLVGSHVQERAARSDSAFDEPRVRGTLEGILPSRLFVPLPHSRALEDLRGRGTSDDDLAAGGPRFAVTVSWGRRYEPWVEDVRLLEASD